MPAVPTPEVVARSIGTAPAAAAVTPEGVLAQRLKDKYAENRKADPLKALEPEATRKPLTVNIDGEVDRRINRDPALATRAKTEANLVKKVSEGRPLTPLERNNLINGLTAKVVDMYPAFRGLPLDQKKSIISEIIDNPRYQETAQNHLAENLSPDEDFRDARLREVTEALNNAAVALDERTKSLAAGTIGLDKPTAEARLDEFKESPGGAIGTKGDQIKRLEINEAAQTRTIKRFEETLQRQLNAGTTNEVLIDAKEQAVRLMGIPLPAGATAEDQLWAEYIRAKDSMQQLSELRGEKSSYKNRIKEIDDIDRLTAAQDNAKRSYEAVKQRQEEQVVEKLETTLTDAANEVLKAEIQEKLTLQQAIETDDQAKAKTDDEKHLIAQQKKHWENPKTKWGRPTFEINKAAVRDAFGGMMRADGPDSLIKAYLTKDFEERNRLRTPPLTNAEKAAEAARIDGLLANEEFMNSARPKFVKGLTTRFLLSGGRVSKDEVRLLRESDWGRGAVIDAVDDNNELKQEIERVYGQNALGGFGERLKRMSDGSFLKWLLLLLGTATLVVPLSMKIKDMGGSY